MTAYFINQYATKNGDHIQIVSPIRCPKVFVLLGWKKNGAILSISTPDLRNSQMNGSKAIPIML